MKKNDIRALLKNESDVDASPSRKDKDPSRLEKSKIHILNICKSLDKDTKVYQPSDTIHLIMGYIHTPQKLDRILYSQISNYIFIMDEEHKGSFVTNIDNLLENTINEDNIDTDCKKIIIKIYDHTLLAMNQIENSNRIFESSIEQAKTKLQEQIKAIEKEYITILGIFASIVLAFVGFLTFSTSIFSNIDKTSVYRILLVVDLLAFVFIHALHLLLQFINVINDKGKKVFSMKSINIACVAVAVLVVVFWLLSLDALPNFLLQCLPWGK